MVIITKAGTLSGPCYRNEYLFLSRLLVPNDAENDAMDRKEGGSF
ncbi:hypothetical protein PA598K_00172 [Paenibacillus sp. 598K]|nr:hypothetical protein PA598K_00172 [Paenibacillus sp. 598K]